MMNTKNRKGFESQSEADLALASMIAVALDERSIPRAIMAQTIETIFNQSGLATREKWRERSDYRRRTIEKAISNLNRLSSIDNEYSSDGLEPKYVEKDLKNAYLFAEHFSEKMLYVRNFKKWFYWDGINWKICEHGEEVQAAETICRKILNEAKKLQREGHPEGNRLVREAADTHRLPRIDAMLKLASSQEKIVCVPSELDADPFLLGVRNGVVNIKENTLLQADPSMRMTKQCNAAFVDDPTCPAWENFLLQVFQEDHETIRALQVLLGYTLIGKVIDEIIIICYGSGANGKSVLNNVIHEILGDYAKAAPSSLLARRRYDDHAPRNDIAHAKGARYLSVNELQAGDRLDEQMVKSLAGREPISTRFLYGEFFTFSPSFTAWVRTNHKPVITDDGVGIWRRIILIPFGRTFEASEQDSSLEEKLLLERDSILCWMLEGATEYLKNGLCMSPRMRAEVNSYRAESDLLGEFLQDMTELSPESRVLQAGLYSTYQEWCKANGLHPHSKKTFTQRLRARGIHDRKSGNERYYLGVKLSSRDKLPE